MYDLSRNLAMFTADEIEARIKDRPFVPVRIVTSSGQMFDVYHPDLVMISRRSLMIGTASTENPRRYELTTRVAIMHITAMEDLPSPSLPNPDGPQ
jgi:hypothetical protein